MALDQRSPSPKRKKNNERDVYKEIKEESVPKFLIMKKTSGDFSKDNPFFIQKTLNNIVRCKNVKKIRDGLLIETEKASDSKILLNTVVFGPYQVEVVAHSSLNSCRGVVYCRDLLSCSVDIIQQELTSQHVTHVRRITSRRDGVLHDTPLLVLTFDLSVLPCSIAAGFYNLKVRPYIPAPVRCFKCQKFGHVASKCSKEQVCVCGRALHEGSPCVEPVCVNCSGPHSVRSKLCPAYKTEMAIQEIKVKERLSYNEARKKVAPSPSPRGQVTYSQAVTSVKSTPATIDYNQLIEKLVPALVIAISQRLPQYNPSVTQQQQQTPTTPTTKTTETSQQTQETTNTTTTTTTVECECVSESNSDMDVNDVFTTKTKKRKTKSSKNIKNQT